MLIRSIVWLFVSDPFQRCSHTENWHILQTTQPKCQQHRCFLLFARNNRWNLCINESCYTKHVLMQWSTDNTQSWLSLNLFIVIFGLFGDIATFRYIVCCSDANVTLHRIYTAHVCAPGLVYNSNNRHKYYIYDVYFLNYQLIWHCFDLSYKTPFVATFSRVSEEDEEWARASCWESSCHYKSCLLLLPPFTFNAFGQSWDRWIPRDDVGVHVSFMCVNV